VLLKSLPEFPPLPPPEILLPFNCDSPIQRSTIQRFNDLERSKPYRANRVTSPENLDRLQRCQQTVNRLGHRAGSGNNKAWAPNSPTFTYQGETPESKMSRSGGATSRFDDTPHPAVRRDGRMREIRRPKCSAQVGGKAASCICAPLLVAFSAEGCAGSGEFCQHRSRGAFRIARTT
jgi:hypothetical protein